MYKGYDRKRIGIPPINIPIEDFLDESTWIIADTHLFHGTEDDPRIVKYANRPLNHNNLIIEGWNQLVQPKDNILHLGDVILASVRIMRDVAPLLRGNKYLIKGNHDSRRKLRNNMGFRPVQRVELRIKGRVWHYVRVNSYGVVFSHQPLPLGWLGQNKLLNLHGHIHNREDVSPRHINMSVEVRGYLPQRFGEVLKEIDNSDRPKRYIQEETLSAEKSITISTT